ncbi:glycerol-3-phosphate 1-O-acyltransferase PlsY [Helicobacter sp. MIT 14-3879]|uniref:glycerol-3-phosphate 1-O-acyltransferase PlsY n=1 Tax=Helicobacter sp. MIT 14-3879 TaxID=2040649 RepID=UPI000E1E3DDA|nr:glycerol-3-phosphate 1-O-acyltransferase PlsY [Helicobacter sp. MIT 14-3879]RDU62274.1 acyl-phosphate--glycerol-3-phosphate O-acyltransferase [Helicobacter sp. MIT 14-3879]
MFEGIIEFLAKALSNINVIFYLIAYLVGGIPFGYFIVKWFYKVNILKIGSGSIGATNVYRAIKHITPYAKRISILTIILDSTKGLVVVLIAKLIGLSYETQWAIAVISVLGHCYSPYLKFNGGKGVSTTIGSTILLAPIQGVIGLIAWFIVGKIFKVSSLSSLIGVSIGILSSFVLYPSYPSISIVNQIGTHTPLVILFVLIVYTHIPNIIRLIKSEESKIF